MLHFSLQLHTFIGAGIAAPSFTTFAAVFYTGGCEGFCVGGHTELCHMYDWHVENVNINLLNYM